jgi:hypothetical protein
MVVEWKGEIKMHLNVNHALLTNNMHKWILKFSKPWCDTYMLIIGWKICDLWLTCNWF